jgi:CheY-like chemotaxis protein
VKPRLLVVEDVKVQLEGIERDLSQIEVDKRKRYAIEGFIVDTADSANTATSLLNEAVKCRIPYDIMLLDLSLPREDDGRADDPGLGLEILDLARRTGAVKSIIVVSAFSEYKNVASAFRAGAIDFIAKVYTREDLQNRVLECWGGVLLKETIQILEERFRTLFPHAERGLAHRFSGCFSKFVQSLVAEVEKLESDLGGRLGLDMEKDAQDPLVRRLTSIESSVTDARREWAGLQEKPKGEDEAPQAVVVENLLDKIVEGLLPYLTLKRVEIVKPQQGTTRVLTFQQDVRTVLTEIIVGGLGEHMDHSEPSGKFAISVESKGRYAEVRFVDDLAPVLGDIAEAINRGNAINPDTKFGRAWGLSVVQDAALRGGGRLEVKPKADGNVITYLIPLAQHA